ncbi:DUF4870 domain-containing protein [Austwickia sp. TVS 96-490-7B]|uniref:DUF4870 domain-containing protein n=1 Tax=Austwickia sp. TVS 96-490-7B TaxID=2830843 RepID=UPI001C5897DB|nr:DUF4870 domain-containing protein [Austwickia sp. TVS 96-490-7B]
MAPIPPLNAPGWSAAPQAGAADSSERNTAMLIHLSIIPFGFIGPLIGYLISDHKPYLRAQSAEALNMAITLLIAAVVVAILCLVLIGFLLVPVLGLWGLVMPIIGGVNASQAKPYRYPLVLRFVS